MTHRKTALLDNLMIGNDPEFFILEAATNRPVLAERIFSVKRRTRRQYPLDYGAYPDNVAGEFNVVPSSCLQEVNSSVGEQMSEVIEAYLRPYYTMSFEPVIEFDIDEILASKEASRFGCSPAYVPQGDGTLLKVAPQVSPQATGIRSIGFHVHIGIDSFYGGDESEQILKTLHDPAWTIRFVRMCDLLVGVSGVLLDQDPRNAVRRKFLGYGRAGEFRKQEHGLEYRVLSAWPLSAPYFTWWANAAVREAALLTWTENLLYEKFDGERIADTINNNDVTEAAKIWLELRPSLIRLSKVNVAWLPATGGRALTGTYPLKALDFIANEGGYSQFLSACDGSAWLNGQDGLSPYDCGFNWFVHTHVSKHPRWSQFNRQWRVNRNNIALG